MTSTQLESRLLGKFLEAAAKICKDVYTYTTPSDKENGFVDKIKEFEEYDKFAVLDHDITCDEDICFLKIRANIEDRPYLIKMLCLEMEQKLLVSVWKLLYNAVL